MCGCRSASSTSTTSSPISIRRWRRRRRAQCRNGASFAAWAQADAKSSVRLPLPLGEGWGEGLVTLSYPIPLTPNLSSRNRMLPISGNLKVPNSGTPEFVGEREFRCACGDASPQTARRPPHSKGRHDRMSTTRPFVGRAYPRLEDPPLLRGLRQIRRRPASARAAGGCVSAQPRRTWPDPRHRCEGCARAARRARRPTRSPICAAVLTADRLPLQFPSTVLPPDIGPFILADKEVSFVGEPIAMVVADSRYVAEDAAGADLPRHRTPAGCLRLPRCDGAGRAGRSHPPPRQCADRIRSGLWRCRCRGRGCAASPHCDTEAASRRRASDRMPRRARAVRFPRRHAHGVELDPACA